MNKENIKKTLSHSVKKTVFCQISRKKICILQNSKGKKSVYTDKVLFSWFRESFSEALENLGQTIMKQTCPPENFSLKIRRTNSKLMQ